MRASSALAWLVVAAGCALAASAPAAADIFEPLELASASPTEQVDYAHHPAISADGRYVAFDGSYGGVTGIWRRDLIGGAIVPVLTCGPGEGLCAELPSISGNGRYISFTTAARLDPQNDLNSAPDVYVRDMDSAVPCAAERGEGEPCEYELASARDGTSAGLTYSYPEHGGFEETHYGTLASGRSALSADGRHVAFVTTAASDLSGPGTPRLEVAVRDLDTKATLLVSGRYDPATQTTTGEPVPAGPEGTGALYPERPPAFGSPGTAATGASISADASTVAWMGQQLADQVAILPGEAGTVSATYTEPLWRRIAPLQATRRVTGGGDPGSLACRESGESGPAEPATLADPCQGPFDPHYLGSAERTGIWILDPTLGGYLPQLSADGGVVAFAASAREIASGEPFSAAEASDDLYTVDMRDGLTRVAALRRLTELAGGGIGEAGRTAPIVDVAVSADGQQVAFATQRTIFPLGSPAYVSAPTATVGPVEMFDADLANDTLTRVTQGYLGQPTEPAGAVSASPSFSANGELLAFSSTADDLVYGDGNAGSFAPFDGSDVFIARRRVLTPTPAETYVSPAPPGQEPEPSWRLSVTARSLRNGSVLLDVLLPGAGTLRIHAESAVLVHRDPAHRARARRPRTRATLATRTVASALLAEREGGLVEVTLRLAHRYQALATKPRGLSSNVLLSFSAPAHSSARASIEASFVRPRPAARSGRHRRRAR